jgi:hypothetical protein
MDHNPFAVSDNPINNILMPNVPQDIPGAFEMPPAMASQSPFAEELDWDLISRNLMLDRPLKLYIPDKEKYTDWEFRIINSIPSEIAAAKNRGFREVTDEKLAGLFTDLTAGTDAHGKAYRPILMARPRRIGEIARKHNRAKLAQIYAGMDPRNKQFNSKYADGVDKKDGTFLSRGGDHWRIRTG